MNVRLTLPFLNAGHFLIHYSMLIFPTAVIAIEKEWGLRYGDALALGSVGYAAFALATLPFGWLGDRVDRRWLMIAFFLGSGVFCIVAGMAASGVMLMIGLAGIGFFAAIYHPVGLALLTDLAERKGRAIAINGVYGNLGLAGAALISAWLSRSFGWRSAFLVPGCVCILTGLAFAMVVPPAAKSSDTANSVRQLPQLTGWSQVRVLVVVMLSALFGGSIFNGVTITLPKVFEERLGDLAGDLSDVGNYVALVFSIAAFAQLPVGSVLDRYGAKPVLLVLLSAQALALLIASQSSGASLVAAALILVTGIFAEIPVTSWLLGHYVNSEWRARAYAGEYVLSLGVSAIIVPLIASAHNQGFGFSIVYQVLVASACVVLTAALFLPDSAAQQMAKSD